MRMISTAANGTTLLTAAYPSLLLLTVVVNRLRGDPAHTLAASYSNLFKNVDKVIDRDGFINDGPLFLKSITIVGLALEDTPCLEVWDASGLTYTSHAGLNVDRSCSWNSESGDGFFRVSQYVIGDFSVVCRFGGQAAATKDKSTLIFKYQNSTGNASVSSSHRSHPFYKWMWWCSLSRRRSGRAATLRRGH